MVKKIYLAGETWDQKLDVRSYDDWIARQKRKPDGTIRLLVAPRRSGKTWFLRGLEYALNSQKSYATVIDLRDSDLTEAIAKPRMKHLLLDEPGKRLERYADDLIQELFAASESRHILLALTPAELELLNQADTGCKISMKSVHWLDGLNFDESRRMLDRANRHVELEELFKQLSAEWKANPFLLELFLEQAEDDPSAPLADLLPRAIDMANNSQHSYSTAVLYNGLSSSLVETIRCVRAGIIDANRSADLEMLVNCGLVRKTSTSIAISDPILVDWMPPPFRIHHISDVHVGANSKKINDNKVSTGFAKKVDEGAGVMYSRDSYLEHLQSRISRATGPQLVIISGDLIERDPAGELPIARQWVDRLNEIMKGAGHPFLAPEARRVVIAGGNHDVNRLKALRESPCDRHQEFVAYFEDFNVPRLDLLPESPDRKLCEFRFHQARTDIALFGSSAFGSEPSNDKNHEMVAAKLKSLEESLGDASLDASQKVEILKQIEWIDPGLVHSKDLQRFAEHQWTMPLRIVVLHHPISPLPILEIGAYTSLLNAGAVKQKLFESDFQLVFHGHVHHALFTSETWWDKGQPKTLFICSAASLGSNAKDEKNGFNEIDILWEGDECKVIARHFELNGNVWQSVNSEVEWAIVKGNAKPSAPT